MFTLTWKPKDVTSSDVPTGCSWWSPCDKFASLRIARGRRLIKSAKNRFEGRFTRELYGREGKREGDERYSLVLNQCWEHIRQSNKWRTSYEWSRETACEHKTVKGEKEVGVILFDSNLRAKCGAVKSSQLVSWFCSSPREWSFPKIIIGYCRNATISGVRGDARSIMKEPFHFPCLVGKPWSYQSWNDRKP